MTPRFRAILGQFLVLTIAAAGSLGITTAAATEATDTSWPLLGRTADVQHNSPLDQINDRTVQRLGLAWWVDMPSPEGLSGNPLVVDGVVYQSGPMGRIYANDVRTGKLLWQFAPEPKIQGANLIVYWALRFNRGLAVEGDKVFVASGDCTLYAVDRKTGKLAWQTVACDREGKTGMYGITGAPRVGAGLVFIGNTCGDSGVGRGYVDAYDQRTGARRWRFYTVPDDPAKGPQKTPELAEAAKTWGTGWYQKSHGCGSVWEPITYDEKLHQVYIGTDGPSPWNPAVRAKDAGDELFTSSIVALDAATGKYRWHFKFDPNNGWNYCPCSHIMLGDLPVGGATRRVVMNAPKDGFFYVLDAKTGKFLSAKNYTPVNWASKIDPKTGRPVAMPDAKYWEKPDGKAVALPGPSAAHNWQAMAYNDKTGLVYIPASSLPTLMISDPNALGGVRMDDYYGLDDPKWRIYGELVAWDPIEQQARWRAPRKLPFNGGLLTTAGNLVLGGTADGRFEAYAADSGKLLWTFDVGGSIQAAPTTVKVDGHQVVLVAAGNAGSANLGASMAKMTSTPATRTQARLLAFTLDGNKQLPKPVAIVVPKPPLPRFDAKLAAEGAVIYEQRQCSFCHGVRGEGYGGTIKDLRFSNAQTHAELPAVVLGGSRYLKGMPKIPGVSPSDLKAIQAYVINLGWDAYDAQQAKPSGTAPKR